MASENPNQPRRNKPTHAPDGKAIQRGPYRYENAKGKLQDQNADDMIGFGDTWLGDLLGTDGRAGVQGYNLRDSREGARRSQAEAMDMVAGQGLPQSAQNVARARGGANTGPQPTRLPSHSDQPYNIPDDVLTGDPPEAGGSGPAGHEYAQAAALAATALAARRVANGVPKDGGPPLTPDENGEVRVEKVDPNGRKQMILLPAETAAQQGFRVVGVNPIDSTNQIGGSPMGRIGFDNTIDGTATEVVPDDRRIGTGAGADTATGGGSNTGDVAGSNVANDVTGAIDGPATVAALPPAEGTRIGEVVAPGVTVVADPRTQPDVGELKVIGSGKGSGLLFQDATGMLTAQAPNGTFMQSVDARALALALSRALR